MKIRLLLALAGLAIGFALPIFAQQKEATPSESASGLKPPPTVGDHFTQVLPDRHVTFRLFAPKANAVEVVIGIKSGTYEPQGTTVAEMTKDPNGLWAVTLGPLEPNLYTYQFRLDGCGIADPGNDMPSPVRHIDTSLLMIPATPPDFLDDQTGAHGTMHDEIYYSKTLGKNRNLLVYTPPSYDRSRAPLPVLYIYGGFTSTRYLWATEGRLAQILDNLLAQGKAVPMIVVLPDPHALAYETTPLTKPDFFTNFIPFFVKNQTTADEELFRDIVPFIQTHYNISDRPRGRAILGASMGGLQALGTGIAHLGYFSWLGIFSPTPPSVLGDHFNKALKDPNKINENLRLFEIVTGDNDPMTGPSTTAFESELRELNIKHVYTIVPGTHSMFVWRPALANFLQEIFKK
jgi:enterochelin esterase-like enzyme